MPYPVWIDVLCWIEEYIVAKVSQSADRGRDPGIADSGL
jgi:hypothetical protein